MGKLIMPHTLRRKMFKLGGEVKSHGVGLTSGLSYNRPGYKKGGKINNVEKEKQIIIDRILKKLNENN